MTIRYREAIGDIQDYIDKYVSSLEYDQEIALYVIKILRNHVEILKQQNIIPNNAGDNLAKLLASLENDPGLLIEYAKTNSFEDIHEALESFLHEKLGSDAGYAPLGRSRNDHVAAAIRLKVAKESIEIIKTILELRKTLILKAKNNSEKIFVTHTHFQPAQVTTFAHYLLSIEEELSDITDVFLHDLETIILKSPLGAAAGAGTCVKIPRTKLAKKLGFKHIIYSPLYATGSRVFLQRFLSNLMLASSAIERMLNDIYLFSNPSINIIKLPQRHLQTSSLMPHKRNPATVEVIRARLSEIRGLLLSSNIIESRIPTGYSLDLQEETPLAWRASRIFKDSLRMLVDIFKDIDTNEKFLKDYIHKYISGVTELVELISMRTGKPFRTVYKEVAKELSQTSWDLSKAVENIAKKYGIEKKELNYILEPRNQVKCKVTAGSFNEAEKHMKQAQKTLANHLKKLEELARLMDL